MMERPGALGRRIRQIAHAVDLFYYGLFLGPRGHGLPRPKAYWDREYYQGRMDLFDSLSESPRYGTVAGYIRALSRSVRVLDVGCGYGRLYTFLRGTPGLTYTGVDCSAEAIEHARLGGGADAAFSVADLSCWRPPHAFDVIVFNEVLYYVDDPVGVLRRYQAALDHGGVIIVSMFRHGNVPLIWCNVERAFHVRSSAWLRNERGEIFEIKVFSSGNW